MAVIFPKWTNAIPKVGTVVVLGGAVFLTWAIWFWFSPKHTDVGYKPVQPIPYSHQLHAGLPTDASTSPQGNLGIDCRYCHYLVEKSAHAGVPPTQVCMNCHAQVKKDSPLLEALRKSWADGTPVPWKRVHKAPDYVYFNHSAHVSIASLGVGVGCKSCHGRIDQMPVVRQDQPLSMSWCLDCHNNPGPNLRPLDKVTDMAWVPDAFWLQKAGQLAAQLNPPGASTGHYRTLVDANGKPVLDEEGHEITARYATASCTGCHR